MKNTSGWSRIEAGARQLRGLLQHRLGHRPRRLGVRPPEAAAILRDATKPFADGGCFGVGATPTAGAAARTQRRSTRPACRASASAGSIEYNSHTWHTNLDTYERIIEGDAQQSAMVIAAAVYHLAMRDQMLPRLPKEKMPPLPTP